MVNPVVDVLKQAREKIARGWTSCGVYALDQTGALVDYDDPRACKFCMMGALRSLAVSEWLVEQAKSAIRAQIDASIVYWNDAAGRTQEEVLAAFDRAIAEEASK